MVLVSQGWQGAGVNCGGCSRAVWLKCRLLFLRLRSVGVLRRRGMVAARLGRRLRRLARLAREALGRDAAALPDIADALQRLEDSVNADLPCYDQHRCEKRGRPRWIGDVTDIRKLKRLQNQLAWQKRQRARAEASLLRRQQAKAGGRVNRTTSTFVARVALSSQLQSSRSFAEAWSDLVGAGSAGLSRYTIESIRSAFCTVVKDLYFGEIETAAKTGARALAPAPAVPAGAPRVQVLLHLHDEASLRL